MRGWLKELRIQSKLTHQQVANLAEIDRSFYTQIESGRRSPSVNTAKKIAGVLKFDWTMFY